MLVTRPESALRFPVHLVFRSCNDVDDNSSSFGYSNSNYKSKRDVPESYSIMLCCLLVEMKVRNTATVLRILKHTYVCTAI